MSRGESPIRIRRATGDSFGSQEGAAEHRRKIVRLVMVSVGIGACSLVYVWQHIQANLVGYELRDMNVRNAQLKSDIRRLNNTAAELASPVRIDALAQRQGMTRQSAWDLVLMPQPSLEPAVGVGESQSFWTVQRERWARLGRRVHRAVGPGEALAQQDDAGATDG